MLSGIGQSGIHPIEVHWTGAERLATRLGYRRLGRWFISRPPCQSYYVPDSPCRNPTAAILTAVFAVLSFHFGPLTFYVGSLFSVKSHLSLQHVSASPVSAI